LTNDFNSLTEKIGKALESFHQSAPSTGNSAVQSGSNVVAAAADALWSWAYIDGVSPESPAAKCGLQRGDWILRFGTLCILAGNGEIHSQAAFDELPSLVASYEGQSIEVVVCRDARVMGERRPVGRKLISVNDPEEPLSVVTINLTPKRWEGRGLLGCHIVPII
jgi:26S proteasome non-ATPase regulatory subunit 9